MGIRDVRDNARRQLHRTMSVAAIYCFGSAVRIPCTVRLWTDDKALGDVKGTAFQYAERIEFVPQAVFLIEDVQPDRGAVIMVGQTEGYVVDNVAPPDGISVTANVTKLLPDGREMAGLPWPGMPIP